MRAPTSLSHVRIPKGFAQNILQPLTSITAAMAYRVKIAEEEAVPKDAEALRKKRAEERAAKTQVAKDAHDEPLAIPQVFPNERNQRSHTRNEGTSGCA